MNGPDVKAALDFDAYAARMYADADLTGDLLSVGLAIAWLLRTGERKIKMARLAEWLGWRDWHKVMWTLADDRPRYVMDTRVPTGGCEAPMIRRDGPCGKRSGWTSAWLFDPDTGERRAIAHCSRHREWAYARARESKGAWERNGAPQPPANYGGVLARYFECDWARVYRMGDSQWQMPRSGPPEPIPPRPSLTLIDGDGDGDSTGDRPTLAVIT